MLNHGDFPPRGCTTLEAYVALATAYHPHADGRPMLGMPFLPLMQRDNGEWLLWCQHLLPNGRCGDHPNRPAICRDYEAGTDWLCALYVPRLED